MSMFFGESTGIQATLCKALLGEHKVNVVGAVLSMDILAVLAVEANHVDHVPLRRFLERPHNNVLVQVAKASSNESLAFSIRWIGRLDDAAGRGSCRLRTGLLLDSILRRTFGPFVAKQASVGLLRRARRPEFGVEQQLVKVGQVKGLFVEVALDEAVF
jgi:hypothetical protein